MKNKILFSFFALLLSSSISWGYVGFWEGRPNGFLYPVVVPSASFRNVSTMGLLNTDLDIMLIDASDLPTIEKKHLYTNLSNLINGNETVFNNGSANYFLFGGKIHLIANIHSGLIYDQNNTYNDLKNEMLSSQFQDMDGNGSYDHKTLTDLNNNAIFDTDNRDLYFGLGKKLGNMRFGFDFRRMSASTKNPIIAIDVPANPVGILPFGYTFNEFSQTVTTTDLITNQLITTTKQDAKSSKVMDGGGNLFALYCVLPTMSQLETGIAIGFGFGSTKNTIDYSATQTRDSNPGGNIVDNTYRSSSFTSSLPQSRGIMGVRVSNKYKINDKVTPELFLSLSRSSNKLDGNGDIKISDNQTTRLTQGAFILTTTNNKTFTTNVEGGEGTSSGFDIFLKTPIKISNEVTFAFGARLTKDNWEDKRTNNNTYNAVATSNDGDNQANDADDWQRTDNYNYKTETVTTTGSTSYSIPVALEFNLTNKLVFRLGANYNILKIDNTTTDKLLNASNQVIVTTYGDGTVTTTTNLPDAYLPIDPITRLYYPTVGIGTTQKTEVQTTNYNYSAGYKVSDNLMIDLMGFNLLTNLANWRLSAVLSF